MDYFLSHQSALEFWRSDRMRSNLSTVDIPRQIARFKRLPSDPGKIASLSKEFWEGLTQQWPLSLPLHILVGDGNARKVSRSLKSHVWSQVLPHGSLLHMDKGLIVSSPEFCFLQMSRLLTLEELIKLGFEICGTYSDSNGNAPCIQCKNPLSSVARIKAFVAKAQSCYGTPKALRALNHIIDGSASPMETALTMLLCLPNNLGGYGLPKPLLNHRIDIAPRAHKVAGGRFYLCDLFWSTQKLAVEYDSDAFHTGAQRIANDSRRRNDLTALGIAVITVTTRQLYNSEQFGRLAQAIARQTDKRLRLKYPEFMNKHLQLRRLLLQ